VSASASASASESESESESERVRERLRHMNPMNARHNCNSLIHCTKCCRQTHIQHSASAQLVITKTPGVSFIKLLGNLYFNR
jgi:hypothetical protein